MTFTETLVSALNDIKLINKVEGGKYIGNVNTIDIEIGFIIGG